MPVLGLVPVIGSAPGAEAVEQDDNLRERDLGVFLDPKSVAAECCRSIRTNILFMSPDRPLRTMVVTSPSPQEGKTTTAINLGVTMAEAGGRVLHRRHRHAAAAAAPLVRRAATRPGSRR